MGQTAFKGNIGKVFGLQFSNDGKPRFSFSVAEGHRKLNKQTNEWEDTGTTWRKVTVFGRDAEALSEVIAEGKKQRVAVIGREETRHWSKDGREGDSIEVVADVVGIVPQVPQGGNQSGGGFGGQQSQPQQSNDAWGQPAGGGNGGWGSVPGNEPAPF